VASGEGIYRSHFSCGSPDFCLGLILPGINPLMSFLYCPYNPIFLTCKNAQSQLLYIYHENILGHYCAEKISCIEYCQGLQIMVMTVGGYCITIVLESYFSIKTLAYVDFCLGSNIQW